MQRGEGGRLKRFHEKEHRGTRNSEEAQTGLPQRKSKTVKVKTLNTRLGLNSS